MNAEKSKGTFVSDVERRYQHRMDMQEKRHRDEMERLRAQLNEANKNLAEIKAEQKGQESGLHLAVASVTPQLDTLQTQMNQLLEWSKQQQQQQQLQLQLQEQQQQQQQLLLLPPPLSLSSRSSSPSPSPALAPVSHKRKRQDRDEKSPLAVKMESDGDNDENDHVDHKHIAQSDDEELSHSSPKKRVKHEGAYTTLELAYYVKKMSKKNKGEKIRVRKVLGRIDIYQLAVTAGTEPQPCALASELYDLCGLGDQKTTCMYLDVKNHVDAKERVLAFGLSKHSGPTGAYCVTLNGAAALFKYTASGAKRTADVDRVRRCAQALAGTDLVKNHPDGASLVTQLTTDICDLIAKREKEQQERLEKRREQNRKSAAARRKRIASSKLVSKSIGDATATVNAGLVMIS